MKDPLTKTQQKTLNYLKGYKGKYKVMPTIPEMAEYFKIAISSTWERLDRLQQKGWIIREKSKGWIKLL